MSVPDHNLERLAKSMTTNQTPMPIRFVVKLKWKLIDWLLLRLPQRPMYARKPVSKIVVYLLASDPPGKVMEQFDWEITAEQCPRLATMNGFTLHLEVAEAGCTQPNLAGSAHLSPDIPLFWSQNIPSLQPSIRRRVEGSTETSRWPRRLAGMGRFFGSAAWISSRKNAENNPDCQ